MKIQHYTLASIFLVLTAGAAWPQETKSGFGALALGMSRDHALAALAGYELQKQAEHKGVEFWRVSSTGRYVGELQFNSGKLESASRAIRAAGQETSDFVQVLFYLLFRNAGASHIEEDTFDLLQRTREARAELFFKEIGDLRIIDILLAGRRFRLTARTGGKEQQAQLDEYVVQELPARK